ncbi:MAG: hypothetical protein EOS37_12770 [Mesorhizobium sp.]|nr:MAG: hypothetical protein EOS37_12770 [Mesorhizobium sp.]TIV32681.1 MAG: hypothetical protein E5V90_02080 [Mesorhizobium sp.]
MIEALKENRKANPRPLSPCVDQTPADIESYYRNSPEGARAVVRETQGGMLRYTLSTIELRRTRSGRINVPGFGDFMMKSGVNCYHPKGQTTLVVPTDKVVAWSKDHPRGELGYSIYPGRD